MRVQTKQITKMKPTRNLPTIVTTVTLIAGVSLGAGVLDDGDFSLWTSTILGGNGGSAMREPIGGNPDARLTISTFAPFGTNTIAAVKSDFITTVAFEAELFTLSFDTRSGPNAAGAGQAIRFLIQQGSDFYGMSLGITGVNAEYTTFTFDRSFVPNSFAHLSGPGPDVPNFSGGVATRFGLAAQNSDSSITNYYDNFHLVSNAVPEPGVGLSLLSGTGMALSLRRARARCL